jgi:serine/threonine protein kinase/tetratricopeptide (TPR) repeat protein
VARDRRAVLQLLASIADGEPPAWDSIDARGPRADASLRVIAGVAELHRTLSVETLPDETPAGMGRVVGRIEPRGASSGDVSEPPTWGPFQLRARIGTGASADVYRAYEPQLDREVAIKLFRAGYAQRPEGASRVLREGRALARIRHEHVVHVYGADEHDGRPGVWMELVSGRTLETELQQRGTWSAREAASAGQDLCQALAAVHRAGLVHGDVKAHNVMREEGGRLLLMDLGSGTERDADPATLHRAGTPLYLAPEVLAGGAPTPASDIYSLGVLLYHLVSGRYPVMAGSMDELRARHARGDTMRLRDVRPDLDAGFVRIVERALAPSPADRYQSAGEMELALAQAFGLERGAETIQQTRRRWPFAAAAVGTAAVLAMWMLWPAPRDSVAVLPFRPLGGQEEAVHLSEGVSADLTSLLSKLPDLTVVSGVSVQRFRNSDAPASEIGKALGVQTLVAGFVQVSGDRIRVLVDLVDCDSSRTLWHDRIDRQTQDLFLIQTEIARNIATALRGQLSARDNTLLQRPEMDYRAFELYSMGRYHWNKRTPDGLRRSIEYFKQAAAVQPSSALPYAGLSDAYVLSEVYGFLPPLEAQAQGELAALRAVALDPTLAEAHAALGSIRQEQLRWTEAEESLEQAIALKPNYAPAHHWYALYLTSHRRFDEAISEMSLALSQDPLYVAMRAALGFIYYMKSDFSTAISEYQRALDLESGLDWLHRNLAIAYLSAGDYDPALKELDKVRPEAETAADLNAIRASVYALAGQPDRARDLLASLERETPAGPVSAIERAAAWFALGEDALGFDWLERAFVNREHDIQYLAVEPRFSRIREDTRFRALLQRAGLPGPPEGRRP